MSLQLLNKYLFRIIAALICLLLILGGGTFVAEGLYAKGLIGIVASPIIIVIATKPPTIKSWLLMIGVLLITMFIVGALHSYETSTHV